MKLFHTEDGKEVVYVQMQDIMYLSNGTDIPIPASIFEKVLNGVNVVTDENRFEFIRFELEDEVKFFKDLEFIIDYDNYKELTNKQLEEKAKELAIKANEMAAKWNAMNEEERENNNSLYQEHSNICYIIHFLYEIYAVRNKKRRMPFPKFVKLSE